MCLYLCVIQAGSSNIDLICGSNLIAPSHFKAETLFTSLDISHEKFLLNRVRFATLLATGIGVEKNYGKLHHCIANACGSHARV